MLVISIFLSQSHTVLADDPEPGDTGRMQEIHSKFTVYTWQLILQRDSRVICTVKVTHTGFPLKSESYPICEPYAILPTVTPTPAANQPTPTPAPTPTQLPVDTVFASTYWIFISEKEVSQIEKIAIPEMVVSIYAPEDPVLVPYLIIKAVEPYSGYYITAIHVLVNHKPMDCNQDTCIVPLEADAEIEYWASSSYGDESKHATAIVRLSSVAENTRVRITSKSIPDSVEDACLAYWENTSYGQRPNWLVFPQSPDELYTEKLLQLLARELLWRGVVDAKNCPGNGFLFNGAPNACGMEAARPAIIEWQNQFDAALWGTGKQVGISPVLLKAILELETQFFPLSSRYYYDEFGLSQINEAGADVALRWNDILKDQICVGLLFDCTPYYASMSPADQALLRGGLVQRLDATCSSCPNGIDLKKAERSIPLIAETVRANCRQVGYLMEKKGQKTSYEDLWRITMISYHSGYECLEQGLDQLIGMNQPITWSGLASTMNCKNSVGYINSLWNILTAYKPARPQLPEVNIQPTPRPTQIPSPTPLPTATPVPYLTSGRIHVLVYIDRNENFLIEPEERLNAFNVSIQYANGIQQSSQTLNGEAIFSYQDQLIGSQAVLRLPDYYKTSSIQIPSGADGYIVFRFTAPDLPGVLP